MDVSLLIRQRLSELGLDQKDLAGAAEVTESYISQLLARKKAPPAPGRTDIYEKIGEFLELPQGELSKLAEVQRQHELKKKVAESQDPSSRIAGSCFCASVHQIAGQKCGGFLRRSPSANSNAWSRGRSWRWSKELPGKNCEVKNGSAR